jgi:hypothetical protein
MSAMSSSTVPSTATRYADAFRTPTRAGTGCSISRGIVECYAFLYRQPPQGLVLRGRRADVRGTLVNSRRQKFSGP